MAGRRQHAVSPIDGLTERQRLAARLLAQGKTIRAVARDLNVSEKTIWLYRQKPTVQRAIYDYQHTMLDQGGGQSIDAVPKAMETLQSIVNNSQARDSDRIAAARTIMNSAAGFAERKMLERQIRDLEKAIGAYAMEQEASMPSAADTPEGGEPLDPLLPSAAVDADEELIEA